jgi:peptidoglycan/xylan/chitin deacetylase (PgdA/CDA1 family)
MYFVKTPVILSLFYKNLIWKVNTNKKVIYLTFDDGPDEEVTPKVLDILDEYDAKATFFCLGNNAEKHPGIIERIVKSGHVLGNHSYSHRNGFKTDTEHYIEDVNKCDRVFQSELFRPPYGRIRSKQAKIISKDFKIIMWSVIPGDFDRKVTKEKCLSRSIKNSVQGTIIVFHDSQKAKEKVLYALPHYLKHFKELEYSFEALYPGLFR